MFYFVRMREWSASFNVERVVRHVNCVPKSDSPHLDHNLIFQGGWSDGWVSQWFTGCVWSDTQPMHGGPLSEHFNTRNSKWQHVVRVCMRTPGWLTDHQLTQISKTLIRHNAIDGNRKSTWLWKRLVIRSFTRNNVRSVVYHSYFDLPRLHHP